MGKPGQKRGHKGVTRPPTKPDKQVEVTKDRDFCRDPEEWDTLVLMEVLTRRFKGIIVCDGWKPYSKFTNRIPRCWAHLLRESKDIAEKIAEAVSIRRALTRRYDRKRKKELRSDLSSPFVVP